jgi:RimJ/RimL family protein N-acetyltransferase
METPRFVSPDFQPPLPPAGPGFVLVQLGVEHNEADLEAWSSSVDHIHATPGFADWSWPDEPMTPQRNLEDLRQHVEDFSERRGFTYSVLSDPGAEVIGCVYIYPSPEPGVDARVRSWVRATHAELDAPLARTVTDWLRAGWPFDAVDYAPRAGV